MPADPAIIGIVLAIAYGLTRTVEFLVKKGLGQKSVLTEEERDWLKLTHNKMSSGSLLSKEESILIKDLHDLHSKTDSNGVPLWYVPRHWGELQRDLADKMDSISRTQEKIGYVLEHIVKKLEKMADQSSKN